MAEDSFWNLEYLFDYAVAKMVNFVSSTGEGQSSSQLIQVFRENSKPEACALIATGLLFGDVYLGFWLTQQPLLSLPSIVFYGSAGLCLISWEHVVITDPGEIPDSFRRDGNGRPICESMNEVGLSDPGNRLVFLPREGKFKPCRSHFCSQMNRHVLRKDHFCFFVSNSIGYKNHKYFYLFLLYGSVAISVETAMVLMHIWQTHPIAQVLLLPGATLSGFLSSLTISYWGFHTYLLCKNLTMIEYFYPKKRRLAYDQGVWCNLKQILGNRWFLWPLPFSGPDGTGVEWGIEEEDLPQDQDEFLQTSKFVKLGAKKSGSSADAKNGSNGSKRNLELTQQPYPAGRI